MRNSRFLLLLMLVSVQAILLAAPPKPADPAKPDGLPKNYKLLYTQDFKTADAFKDFKYSDPKQWKYAEKNGAKCLECTQKSGYRPKVRSPHTISLIKKRLFGDFVLECDLLQTGKNYGHRDMCIYFNYTDPTKFYYVHMATRSDPHAHNIMIVNDKPRVSISTKTTKGIDWGQNKWHKIKIVRKTATGEIKIYFDDMKTPIMLAKDTTFKLGHIGFGTFDDSGCVKNIRIWGPNMVKKETPFFKPK